MVEARRRDEWNRASHLLALIANCNRDPKQRRDPFTPAEFDPFRQDEPRKTQRVDSKQSWAILKQSFTTGTGVAVALRP